MTAKLESIGISPVSSSTPAEFGLFVQNESRRWSTILKESGNIKLD
jgi:hypothetical protein